MPSTASGRACPRQRQRQEVAAQRGAVRAETLAGTGIREELRPPAALRAPRGPRPQACDCSRPRPLRGQRGRVPP